MISAVSPVPSCSMPSASTFPELTSRIVMRAPPTALPIILASRAMVRTMTLVSLPAGRANSGGTRTAMAKTIVLSKRLTFIEPSRNGRINIQLKLLVGQTISYLHPHFLFEGRFPRITCHLGSALLAISLGRDQEKQMMRKLEVQIGNSGYNANRSGTQNGNP